MVRLKGIPIRSLYSFIRFQFLMVRLKVLFRLPGYCSSFISIPYGSIKRGEMLDFRLSIKEISIPYGSIKSFYYSGKCNNSGISIPYGSIKSQADRSEWQLNSYFNSLWFD